MNNNYETAFGNKITVLGMAKELMPDWGPVDWFSWPPDIFALTSLILRLTGIYRYVVSGEADHPGGLACPWAYSEKEQQNNLATYWHQWIYGQEDVPPQGWDTRKLEEVKQSFEELQNSFFNEKQWLVLENDSSSQENLEMCNAILRVHALADMASLGYGLPKRSRGLSGATDLLANFLLLTTGSLSRLPKRHGVVLPKMRTPQTGITVRSLSHHLTHHLTEVTIDWRSIPWVNRDENTVNILAIPFPYEIKSQSFAPSKQVGKLKGFEYFKYEPGPECAFCTNDIICLLREAEKEVNRVHILVFPELALTEEELTALKTDLSNKISPDKIPIIITGIRGTEEERKNKVRLSTFFVGRWYDLGQDKHHRWKLDGRQIRQYSLAGGLNVRSQWWEGIKVPQRRLTFLAPNGWLALCPLICEDLGQLEPVSELIRGVGPTLVIAILMDGPQLRNRWSARYVGVLADDPGTSILTLTSLGMAMRYHSPGEQESRVVALWKDQQSGDQEISLKPDARGLLLTINADWKEEFTADGRSDGGSAATFALGGVLNLSISQSMKGNDASQPAAITREDKDVKEATAFTYFVHAILDAPVPLVDELHQLLKTMPSPPDFSRFRQLNAMKPFVMIWQRVIDRLAGTSQSSKNSWPGDEFQHAVEVFVDFIKPLNSAYDLAAPEADLAQRNKKMFQRWKEMVERATRALANDGQLNSALHSIQAARNWPDDTVRLDKLVYFSILYAIHDRLMLFAKNEKNFDVCQKYNKLIEQINKSIFRREKELSKGTGR